MQQQSTNIHEQDTAEIIQIEMQGATLLLKHFADLIVTEQHDKIKKRADHAKIIEVSEYIAEQSPDLTAEDGVSVKIEGSVQQARRVHHGNEIYNQIADGNI